MSALPKPWNLEEIKAALLELLAQSKQSETETRFAEVYDDVRKVLDEGVPLNRTLEMLARHGLKMSPATFKKFANNQAKIRGETRKAKGSARKPRKSEVAAVVPAASPESAGNAA